MKIGLYITKQCDVNECTLDRRFHFAVIDFDKASSYPMNFVCTLPTRVNPNNKELRSFKTLFGDQSLETAKKLLYEALETENDPEVKAEIERRLKLLKLHPLNQKLCLNCGNHFLSPRIRGFTQKYCSKCEKNKFRARYLEEIVAGTQP